MLHSLFMLAALVGGMSMPLAIDDVNVIEDKIEFKQDNKKFVSYNDVAHSITFSANDLNTYIWKNFNDTGLSDSFSSSDFLLFTYGTHTFSIDEITFSNGEMYIGLINDDDSAQEIKFNGVNNTYLWTIFNSNVQGTFDVDLTIEFDSEYYSVYKQAIELDIQANTQPYMMPVLEEIVSLLTGGIIGIATGVGGGVSDLVTNIFLNNGHLSVFGAIIAVFGGIALAIGLSRWVMNFLTSLGAKK